MADALSVVPAFIKSLKAQSAKHHSVKVRTERGEDGEMRSYIVIAVRPGVNLDVPKEFQGVMVKQVPWPR